MTTDGIDDVIARWNDAKLKHRSAPVYGAGDALASELQSCRARITELEAALRFYADPDSYDDAGAPGHTCHLGTDDEYFEADYGARARAALEKP